VLLAALAEQERVRLSERVAAGLERARIDGRPEIESKKIKNN
jgi:DNA invertase Pin-like site-specific DNA recombinase